MLRPETAITDWGWGCARVLWADGRAGKGLQEMGSPVLMRLSTAMFGPRIHPLCNLLQPTLSQGRHYRNLVALIPHPLVPAQSLLMALWVTLQSWSVVVPGAAPSSTAQP